MNDIEKLKYLKQRGITSSMVKEIERVHKIKKQIQPFSISTTKLQQQIVNSPIFKAQDMIANSPIFKAQEIIANSPFFKAQDTIANSSFFKAQDMIANSPFFKVQDMIANSLFFKVQDSVGLTTISKIQEMINDLNSSFPCDFSKQNEKFKTFDPEKEALEEVVDILSDPLESNFETRVGKFVSKNKYKIQILVTVLTFLCWYFQEQVESLRVNSQKELISYVISKIQESNPELLTKTNSQTSETTFDQINPSLEHQLKLNIFSEDQD